LVTGLVVGLVVTLVGERLDFTVWGLFWGGGPLILGLVAGLDLALRNGGWFVLLQKVAHRRLARTGNFPSPPYDILEWGVETKIFRRVGGGVRFRHNLIQQHLASTSEPLAKAKTVSSVNTREKARTLELLATVAIVGLAFFAVIASLLPLISEYTLTADTISELAIGRFGYLQTVAFFAAGLGTLALAWGIREVTKGSWGSSLGSTLVGLYGVGIVLAGLVHIVVSVLAFVLSIVGVFVLSRTFKRDARWRAFWPWSLALAFTALVGFIMLAISEGAWIGLIERIFLGTVFLWQVLVAFRIRSISKGASAEHPSRVR
jgi:hypothetical protein